MAGPLGWRFFGPYVCGAPPSLRGGRVGPTGRRCSVAGRESVAPEGQRGRLAQCLARGGPGQVVVAVLDAGDGPVVPADRLVEGSAAEQHAVRGGPAVLPRPV